MVRCRQPTDPMDTTLAYPDLAVFIALVALGAATQTITGFAMGLVIVAGVALVSNETVAFAAAVVGILSMVNSLVALRDAGRKIDRRLLGVTCITLLPMLIVGVWLLEYLSGVAYWAVKQLLGLLIIVAGGLLLLRPAPWSAPSGAPALLTSGIFGGLAAGLYSSGGSVLAFVMYRQPAAVEVIRSTLLSFFLVTTALRTAIIAIDGQLTTSVLLTSALSLPVVVLVTWLATRVRDRVPDLVVRRVTAIVLALAGAFLLAEPLL